MQPGFWTSLQHITGRRSISVSNLYGLSGVGKEEMELFSQVWPKVPVERRRRVLKLLVELTESTFAVDFGAVFRFCLSDEDEEVRKAAIEGLWEEEDTALIDPLVNILKNDPSVRVRAAAASILGRFVLLGELEELKAELQTLVEEALLEAIHSPSEDLEVKRRAVEAIAFSGRKDVRAVIEDAYHHEWEKMRISAVFAMGRSADSYWNEIVIAELRSPDAEMRCEAARACGELEIAEAVPHLAPLTQDPDREVQEAAIWALGHIGGAEARRILEKCYEEGDEVLREAVEEALEYLEFLASSPEVPSLSEDFEE